MPAIASLVINDGQTTPVAHTFAPVTTDGAEAKYADRAPALPIGYLQISHEVRQPASSTAAYRVITGFNFPVLATINSVLTKVRNSSAQVVFNFAQDSTDQERKDALAYVSNFLANSTVKTSIQNVEPFY